ncbi:MAG: sensor domain-containing diguanylate cyclase [Fusobacterium sp. JB021]|nr:sensor domain-containing diguanylate cyclase [Fusobacterium sp. JB020]MDP0492867.1 sensor domain-containing diguanylate cyclase [Fusobacterium sp. JB021]MDP0507365.1 sensor domain-containing diguanylate cyclase [Fusobacterium sp. JB019]
MEKNMYTKILNGISEGVYFVDVNRKINFWNKAAEDITGYRKSEIIEKHCYNNILNHVDDKGNHLCMNGCPLLETIKDGKSREMKVYLRHKKGYRVPVIVKVMPIYDKGEVIGAVETFTDISPNKMLLKSNNDLMDNIFRDELTKLPNRKYLNSHLDSVMLKYKNLNTGFGVMFLDIDFFKKVNDTYGHDVGDEVLQMIAKVFNNSCRDNDVIGRWGGEEFIGVFENVDENKLIEIANRIRVLVENSELNLEKGKIKVTISIGVSLIKEEDSIGTLVKRADEGVYLAKKNGRNRVEFKK